jgi:hypothetical protein
VGAGDGTIVGATKIVDNGPDAARYNLVIVAEGYQAAQLAQFAADARRLVDKLRATAPFDRLMPGINVHRLDVSSTDAGADQPTACGGSGATPRTFFDATFCTGGIQRLLTVDAVRVVQAVNARVPAWHTIAVIVNTPIYGGSGGSVAVYSLAAGADEIALHEMGHTAFGLADEYQYYRGCGSDTDRDRHPAGEPGEPNVTVDRNRATIKWRDLIAAATPVPTTANPDCTQCDSRPSPVPPATVGAFEGAHYYHCGAYRPQFDCRMRTLGQPFCAVCRRAIEQTLQPFMPVAHGLDSLNQAAWVAGTTTYRFGYHSIPNIPITGEPADADAGRWSMLHVGTDYRLYAFQAGTTARLYQFAYNGASYAFGFHSIPRLDLVGFPADTDAGSVSMLHDGTDYRLYLRRTGQPQLLYQAAWVPGSTTYRYGFRSLPQIPVTGFPADTDWSRWSMLHDGTDYRFYAMRLGSDTELSQGAFTRAGLAYEFGFRSIPRLTLVGAPASSDPASFAMLHDGADYRFYFQTR